MILYRGSRLRVQSNRRWNSVRIHTVDLTDLMCDASLCYPVIGGALVFRDQSHMTPTFARTLGPYLDHAIPRTVIRSASG